MTCGDGKIQSPLPSRDAWRRLLAYGRWLTRDHRSFSSGAIERAG